MESGYSQDDTWRVQIQIPLYPINYLTLAKLLDISNPQFSPLYLLPVTKGYSIFYAVYIL